MPRVGRDPKAGERIGVRRETGQIFRLPVEAEEPARPRAEEVLVLDDGKRFRYRETEYASLSEIAREITGARWSGPRFFGLKKLKGAA